MNRDSHTTPWKFMHLPLYFYLSWPVQIFYYVLCLKQAWLPIYGGMTPLGNLGFVLYLLGSGPSRGSLLGNAPITN